jgi:hypothetical protein
MQELLFDAQSVMDFVRFRRELLTYFRKAKFRRCGCWLRRLQLLSSLLDRQLMCQILHEINSIASLQLRRNQLLQLPQVVVILIKSQILVNEFLNVFKFEIVKTL